MKHDKPNKCRERQPREIIEMSVPEQESDWCEYTGTKNVDDRYYCRRVYYKGLFPTNMVVSPKKYENTDNEYVTPKKVRCPVCERRMTPRVDNCESWGFEPFLKIPRHKKKHKDRPSNKKDRRETTDKGCHK